MAATILAATIEGKSGSTIIIIVETTSSQFQAKRAAAEKAFSFLRGRPGVGH
jgi:hypothetical protein